MTTRNSKMTMPNANITDSSFSLNLELTAASDAASDSESEYADTAGTCLCGSNEFDTTMICCDSCEVWFHQLCVNITPSEAKAIDKYCCVNCRDDKPVLPAPQATPPAVQKRQFSITAVNCVSFLPVRSLSASATSSFCYLPPSVPREAAHNDSFVSGSSGADSLANVVIPCPKGKPFRIVHGRDDPLSNMWKSPLFYNGRTFHSVEQCYHFLRAEDLNDLRTANLILRSDNPFTCKRLARYLSKRPSFDIALMTKLLEAKFNQCCDFKSSLIESVGKALLHSTHTKDTFWCTGLNYDDEASHFNSYPGNNVFGRLLSDLRNNMLITQCSGTTSLPSVDINYCNKPVSIFDLNVPLPTCVISSQNQTRCFYCFETGHSRKSCGFKRQVRCQECGKLGHKRKFCHYFNEWAKSTSCASNSDRSRRLNPANHNDTYFDNCSNNLVYAFRRSSNINANSSLQQRRSPPTVTPCAFSASPSRIFSNSHRFSSRDFLY